MCKLIKNLIKKIMATFTINHNGLPPLSATDINYYIDPENRGLDQLTEDMIFDDILSQCQLGAQPTIISFLDPLYTPCGTFEIMTEDGLNARIALRAPWLDIDDLTIPERFNTLDYKIMDSFGRETATAKITVTFTTI